jgi:hypothetical protein
MNLFDIEPPPEEPAAKKQARHILATINNELQRRIQQHAAGYHAFWDADATPDDILSELGINAALVIESSRANLQNLHHLAQLVGKTLDDLMPRHDWYPRREFIITNDGSATLAPPAEGHDAWGRPFIP